MGKHGQFNYKGINYQSWAAMSLFLQYLRNSDFLRIELESANMEDFNLIFRDGHKIICEAKARRRNFTYSDLKSLVRSMSKHLKDNDEILVICSNLSQSLEDKVKNMKYFSKQMAPHFKRKGFGTKEIQALSKVRFWNVSEEAHYNVVYSLFGELLNFWLPQAELEQKADSILLKKIYEGSAKGQSYSREDILLEIDGYRKNAIKYSGYFDIERVNVEKQLKNLIRAIEDNKSPEWAEAPLSAISAQPNLMFYVIDKFKNKKIKSLKDWANLWNLNKIYGFSFSMYKIFENNLHSIKNRKYVLDFIKKDTRETHNFYRHNFFVMNVVKIINRILDKDTKSLNQAFNRVKEILVTFKNDYFYLKSRKADRDFEKEKICKLLKRIYLDGAKKIKKEIYNLIIVDFNLIEDQGEFSHYTSIEIFEILRHYITSDLVQLEKKFTSLIKELSQQYNKFYKKFGQKVTFDGWELMGGTTSFWGGNYKIEDRHFVKYVLEPALSLYYKDKRESCWKFIKEKCLIKDNNVDINHPDFLNRAALNVILERFNQEDYEISNEAFEILKNFVLRRKGIPHKSELICQALQGDFPDAKKWKLANVSIKHYKTPVNPFIERIVSELATKGHKEAKEVFNSWAKNSDYYKKTEFLGRSLTQHIDKLLDSSFDDAVNIFKNYINSEYFIKELDNFDAYKVAGLLGKILRFNFEVGVVIINHIKQSHELSKNQQILISFGVLDSIDKKSENLDFVKKAYYRFMDPFLAEFDNDINKILQTFPHGNAREAFVQFAEKLANNKLINEALRIVEIFINDPDPFPPGKDPEDLEGKYSHHKKIKDEGQETSSINSVRGWSAWTLAHCVILSGRVQLPKIIELTKRLVEDEDYYVQHMTCFPLSRLISDRLCHMPEDKNTLFFNDDKKTALKMAKNVEEMALDLLDRILASSSNVQKALAKSIMSVVGRIRTLNQKDALMLIEKLRKFPDEETSEITSLFLYYAEFRKDSFKDWKWSFPGLYDDLQPFDDTELKIKLKEIMLDNSETKAAFAWEFYSLTDCALRKVKNSLDYEEAIALSVKYIKDLLSEYDHRTFETVYRFINENIKELSRFNTCYELWLKCLKQEKSALEKMIKNRKAYDVYWWPYDYNGNILVLINEQKGQKDFLDAFEFLSKYPKEVDIGNIKNAVELIKRISSSNKQVEGIFNNLIERNASFYDDKQQWLKQ
ncbi:MAG: hypothetical protein HQ534_02490 [Armatimonadetes bacterium]|nr:hypothetical protein [Armatimonadota bacterium]